MITKDSLDNRCKAKKAKHDTLYEVLFVWPSAEREHGLPVSEPIIQQKAFYLNKQLPDKNTNLTPSQGWLDRWEKQHDVPQLPDTKESLSTNSNAS